VKKDEIQQGFPGFTCKQFPYTSHGRLQPAAERDTHSPDFSRGCWRFSFNSSQGGTVQRSIVRSPTPDRERLPMASCNSAVRDFDHDVQQESAAGKPDVISDNFDTGSVTGLGEYPLADITYANLIDKLAEDHFSGATSALRATILDFYKDPNAPIATKKDKRSGRRSGGRWASCRPLRAAPPRH
jgi:hypothetical protein